MTKLLSPRMAVLVAALLVGSAPAAIAQSMMIKGKVVGADKEPIAGVTITVELVGGNRKLSTKTDKRGEFIQLLTESGVYRVTASEAKIGSATSEARVTRGTPAEVTIVLVPNTVSNDAGKAAELRKVFDEGVEASRAGNHDAAIDKFRAALAMAPSCFDCHFNIGVAYMAKKDEKAAEAAWKQALDVKADYAEALNALSTLYNNQKRFEEAAAMSAKATAAGGSTGNADALFNQGIILWNQGKIADAKVKFEEAIAANASHADAHYQLGMAWLNEGKVPEAVTAFETYLKLAPDGQFATQAKSMVAQLKK